MSTWETPKVNWQSIDKLLKGDMNRIEGNLDFLVEREAAVRQMLANAITAMGQSASAGETYQQLAAKIKNISKDANAQPEEVLEGKTFYSGGVKKTGIWPGPMFGAGVLGDYDFYIHTYLDAPPGSLIVNDYKSFRVRPGCTYSTRIDVPVRALVIRSLGDIIIDGTISLDKRGGCGDRYITIGGEQYDLLGGFGGNGGSGFTGGVDNGGKIDCGQRAAGGLRGGGGGGGGGGIGAGDGGPKNARSDQVGVRGSRAFTTQGHSGCEVEGTAGTFGAGGGGSCFKFGENGYAYGGLGGDCTAWSGAAGGGGGIDARFPSSGLFASASDGYRGKDKEIGGGALVLIAAGNVIINSTGTITARGGEGEHGGDANRNYGRPNGWAGGGGGGGGSGGGRVIILYRGSYINNGNIDLSGGLGGLGGSGWDDYGYHSTCNGYKGSPGQAGSVQVKQLL